MLSAAFIWAKTIGYLEQQLDAVTVATWFDDAELVELNEEHLILYTPSLLRRNVIMDRCKDYVEAVLKECKPHLRESEWFFPEDIITDQPERQIASALICW